MMQDALLTTAQIARIYRVTSGRIRQVIVERNLRPNMIAGHCYLWHSSRIDQFDPRLKRKMRQMARKDTKR